MYIKEVAKKSGDQKVAISKAILLNIDKDTVIEWYKDDVKQGEIPTDTDVNESSNNSIISTNTTNLGSSTSTNTTKKKILPYTGSKATVAVILTIVAISGIFMYVKYRKLNKYTK